VIVRQRFTVVKCLVCGQDPRRAEGRQGRDQDSDSRSPRVIDMQREGWPEPGDLVVCTVDQVVDFGAFVSLDEYVGKSGLIHISEVASGWIKYIRDHVREGQKIVCKVLSVDRSRYHIDLSLKDVNEHQRREKIQQWKADQKAWKWLQMAYEGRDADLARVTDGLLKSYHSLYGALEDVAIGGAESLAESGLLPEDIELISQMAKDNVKIPTVEIAGYVDLTSPALMSRDNQKGSQAGKEDQGQGGHPRHQICGRSKVQDKG